MKRKLHCPENYWSDNRCFSVPDYVQNMSKLFADDLKVIVDASDKEIVLNMLKNQEKWQNLWLLKFKSAKCKVMHIPFNGNPTHEYTFEGVSLEIKRNFMNMFGFILN